MAPSTGSPLEQLHALVEAGYPRPQLVRPSWVDLCGAWELAFDDAGRGERAGFHEPGSDAFELAIEVPFPPESSRSGIGDRSPHPVVWYRRRLTLPARADDEQIVLHFGAVDYAATVWLDGDLLGRHEGGHTPFSFELDRRSAGECVLVVRAEDRAGNPFQPRGKQDWQAEPHRIWYARTTGIWQPVWLEVVPCERVSGLALGCDVAHQLVVAELELAGEVAAHRVRIRLLAGAEVLAEQEQLVVQPELRLAMHVAALENVWDLERLAWSPESPRLIGVEIELLARGGGVTDRVLSYTGLRSVGATDRRFLLNKSPHSLRMVLSQGYWPDSHLAAPGREALRGEVELARSLGFDGVRLHQKIEDPLFLYWADRLGLLVWEEMPSPAGFSPAGSERLVREWLEVLRRDRSHPSIVAWVPFNESWGVAALAERADQRQLVAGVTALTRAIDPTRPVVSNDGWEHVDSDIVTIHDYSASGEELRQRYGSSEALRQMLGERWPAVRRVLLPGVPDRGQPVVLSEFGGIAFTDDPGAAWHGYSTVSDATELADRLGELFGAVQQSEELAGFCYTQLADTEQESNGLVFADRTPKVEPELLAAIVRGEVRATGAAPKDEDDPASLDQPPG
ncbi:MAG TPA: glycoside hydrolase family 2 TIM barrel-domain containing protein [Acidimicrobiales bacterium]|nr:glycoside hydrolase family 2 TIM barrel-domain containing protein [Acidimicrobiales bacterium]